MYLCTTSYFFFFFNDPSSTEIYTLSLHDALPICAACRAPRYGAPPPRGRIVFARYRGRSRRRAGGDRSEEHTSELQSRGHLVCRLLLEKKNIKSKFGYAEVLNDIKQTGL